MAGTSIDVRAAESRSTDLGIPISRSLFPLSVSQRAIGTTPRTVIDRKARGDIFVAIWPQDQVGRSLAIAAAVMKPGAVPYLKFGTREVMTMVPGCFGADKVSGHEAVAAGVAAAWGSEVEWDLGCAHVLPATDARRARAPKDALERGLCKFYLCFHWLQEDERKGVMGVYVLEAPRDDEPDPLRMLATLDLKFSGQRSASYDA